MRTPMLAAYAAIVLAAGCAAQARPSQPEFRRAIGEACTRGARATPMLLDLDSAGRAELDAALQQGVVAVAYDCATLRILPACSIDQAYGYMSLDKRTETLTFTGEREISANLPIGGLTGKLGQDASLEASYAIVGEKSVPIAVADVSQLRGDCAAATHVVTKVAIGAFTLSTRAAADTSAEASVHGVGASATSSSDRTIARQDGDLAACPVSSTSEAGPPAGCAAPLRLELTPITSAAVGDAPGSIAVASGWHCPSDLTWVNGQCVDDSHLPADRCSITRLDLCREQCSAGNGRSCNELAFAYLAGRVVSPDRALAADYAQRACDLGDQQGCGNIGGMYLQGAGVRRDLEHGVRLLDEACRATAAACVNLGNALSDRTRSEHPAYRDALRFYRRGCSGGDLDGCEGVAAVYWEGDADLRDEARSLALSTQYCANGWGYSCRMAGLHTYQGGLTLAADEPRGATFLQRGCALGDPQSCGLLGLMYEEGAGGMPVDPQRADLLVNWSCARHAFGCTTKASLLKARGDLAGAATARARACELDASQCE